MDLLLRLLAFHPRRRCTAEEALSHEYLVDLENEDAMLGDSAVNLSECFMAHDTIYSPQGAVSKCWWTSGTYSTQAA